MTARVVESTRAGVLCAAVFGTLLTAAACSGEDPVTPSNDAGSGGAQAGSGTSQGGSSGVTSGANSSGGSGGSVSTGGSQSTSGSGAGGKAAGGAGKGSALGGAGAGGTGDGTGGKAGNAGSGTGGMSAGTSGTSGGSPSLGGAGSGGGNSSGGTSSQALSFEADIWPMFSMIRDPVFVYPGAGSYESCVTTGVCHGGRLPGADLNMSDVDTAYDMLFEVPSTTELCAGTVRVVPGDPEQSCLVLFYEGRLRDELDWVDDTEIDKVREWIAQGALP